MKSRLLTSAVIVLAGIQLSGCASVIKGSTASLGITTPPVTGATCTLSSSEGSWQMTSPGTVTVSRSKHDINIRCTKEGYQEAAAVIPSSFEGWTLGNLLIGGIIGVGVDAATGAMNDYPNAFQVPMTPLAPAMSSAPLPPPPAATPPVPATPATKPKPNKPN